MKKSCLFFISDFLESFKRWKKKVLLLQPFGLGKGTLHEYLLIPQYSKPEYRIVFVNNNHDVINQVWFQIPVGKLFCISHSEKYIANCPNAGGFFLAQFTN